MRRRGNSEIPARCAVVPLTAWKRCGILTTREVKGNPAKKAFLISSTSNPQPQSHETQRKRPYSNIPANTRLFSNRIGKIGSCLPLSFCFRSTHTSQPTKPPHAMLPTAKLPTIAALPHAYLVPALSSAKTTRIDAPNISKHPRKSILSHFRTVNLALRRLRIFVLALEKSEGRKKIMIPIAAAPAGALCTSESIPILSIHLSLSLLFPILRLTKRQLRSKRWYKDNLLQQKHPSPRRMIIDEAAKQRT
jgi:hypothetical protein